MIKTGGFMSHTQMNPDNQISNIKTGKEAVFLIKMEFLSISFIFI
jgi:hypothetical protein